MPVNPFTARSGVDPRVFVGRQEELRFFRDERLARAMDGRCNHYVITGTWGIGKTVLLRQMKLIAQTEGAWALLFCMREFGREENLTEFVRHVLGMAAADLPVRPRQAVPRVKGAGATALGFGVQLSWDGAPEQEHVDPQLQLRDGLLGLHDYARSHGAKALVLLIDDVHNLTNGRLHLTLLRNVLTDNRVVAGTNILVVMSSIDSGWEPFLIRDHPIGRLFMPRRSIGFFTETETAGLIDASLDGSGVAFEAAVSDRVHEVTRGHVFEVQALCEALFDRQIRGRVSMENWETALHHTLIALADAGFKGMLGRASDQEFAVLRAIARSGEALGPSSIGRLCPEVGGVREVLRRMASKGLVERSRRGSYRLTDWLLAEYVRRFDTAL